MAKQNGTTQAPNQGIQIKTLRHTAEVLCLKFNSLRVVSGSADGKVRIWNMRTADCIRIFRGNSHCDPIVSLSFGDNNSICVNTKTSMQVLYFDSSQEEHARSATGATAATISKQLKSEARIRNYKKQAPMLRSRSSISFAGQWRATEDGRSLSIEPGARSQRVAKPFGDGSAFSNSGTWSVNDGHQQHQETTQQQIKVRRSSMRKSISMPALSTIPVGASGGGKGGRKGLAGAGAGAGAGGRAAASSNSAASPSRSRRDSTPFRSALITSPMLAGGGLRAEAIAE